MLITPRIVTGPRVRLAIRHITKITSTNVRSLQLVPSPLPTSFATSSFPTSSRVRFLATSAKQTLTCQRNSGSGFDGYDDGFNRRSRDPRNDFDDEHRGRYNSHDYDSRRNEGPGNNREPPEEGGGGFKGFVKRWGRNLFLLTGGVVWCGLLYVGLFGEFVDPSPTEEEAEIRNILFFDIQNDDEAQTTYHNKELAVRKTVDMIKENIAVKQRIGAPVQLCGVLVRDKVSKMIGQVQSMSRKGMADLFSNLSSDENCWTAECVLEGPEGLVSVKMDFVLEKEEWKARHVVVDVLVKEAEGHLLEIQGPLLEG